MSMDRERLDFLRQNPTIAAKALLNVQLDPYQRIMVKTTWEKLNTLWLVSRGGAKTFCAVVVMSLFCLLHDKVACGVVAGNIPQANNSLIKLNDIYAESPALQAMLVKSPNAYPGDKGVYLPFRNHSSIETIPLNTRRGRRKNIIFADEYREIDERIFNTVVRPMLSVKHPIISNRLLIASTATYDELPLSNLYKEYKRLVEEGNTKVGLCDFNLDIVKTGSFVDSERIEIDRQTMLPEEFDMEYMNIFISLRDGWIPANVIRGAEREFKPLYIGNKDKEYVIGSDIARAQGGDNSSFSLFEITSANVRFVRNVALNGISFDEQALTLKQLCRDFNVIRCRMDYDQGGKAIRDALSKVHRDPRDGAILPPLLPLNSADINGRAIIENINFANKNLIWSMGVTTKKGLQDQVLVLPKVDERIVLSDEELKHLDVGDRKAIEIHREIQETKKELTQVKVKADTVSSNFTFYTSAPRRNKKDRFTSFILGASCALEIFEDMKGGSDQEFVGIWG